MMSMTYGNPDAPIVLIQMVDDHDLEGMESGKSLPGCRHKNGESICMGNEEMTAPSLRSAVRKAEQT